MQQDAPSSNTNGIDPFPTTTFYPTTVPDPVELLGRHASLSDAKPSKFSPAGLASGSRDSGGSGLSLSAKCSGEEIIDILSVDRTRRPSGSARLSRHSSEKDEDEEIANCRYDVQRSSISSEKLPIRPSSSKHSDVNLRMSSNSAAKFDSRAKNSVTIGDVEFGDIDDDLEVGDPDLEGHVTVAPAVKQSMFRVDSKAIDVQTAVVSDFQCFINIDYKGLCF